MSGTNEDEDAMSERMGEELTVLLHAWRDKGIPAGLAEVVLCNAVAAMAAAQKDPERALSQALHQIVVLTHQELCSAPGCTFQVRVYVDNGKPHRSHDVS